MITAPPAIRKLKKTLEILQGSFWDADLASHNSKPKSGEGVGLATSTTYTYATNTPAYLNPHAVATTTAGSALAYTYDNNGNLLTTRVGTSTPTASYTWDYNNRMTQAVINGTATSTW